MLLLFSDQQPFATGAAHYWYRAASPSDRSPRITVRVELEGVVTFAVLDTGAPYVVCSPEVARSMRLTSAAALERARILIRGVWVNGDLHRLNLKLPADQGESFSFEVTAFVPDAREGSIGSFPSFLGLNGCLERIRFALDPSDDTFYFGTLEN